YKEKRGEQGHTYTRLPANNSCTACSVGSMKWQLSVLSELGVKRFAWGERWEFLQYPEHQEWADLIRTW
ncbi:hypothetical protein ACQP3J_32620, partial [Escherichia coli]